MKKTNVLAVFVLVLSLTVCLAEVAHAVPMGTAFIHQGFLIDTSKKQIIWDGRNEKGNMATGLYLFVLKVDGKRTKGTKIITLIN